MTLSQTLLDAARDEVAKEYGFNEWSMMMYSLGEDDIQHLSRMSKRAALLAMEKQTAFYRWASEEQYLIWSNNYWVRFKTYEAEGHHFTLTGNREHGITELELYEIFTTPK